jgi:hypothetical protein
VNAVHGLAHVMYEAGAGEEAEALIADWLPGYDRSGGLYSHIAWHGALHALERGDTDRALAVYADSIAPAATMASPINVVSDTTSFLWRLQAYGHTVPEGLWADAATYASQFFQQPVFAFADVHMALVAAATGDKAAVEQRALALTALIQAGRFPAGPVVPAICRAVLAFAQEDYAGCARVLESVVGEAVRLGGSGAQRDVVEDTLLVALMRSGESSKARALLDQRLKRRRSPLDTRWLDQLTHT